MQPYSKFWLGEHCPKQTRPSTFPPSPQHHKLQTLLLFVRFRSYEPCFFYYLISLVRFPNKRRLMSLFYAAPLLMSTITSVFNGSVSCLTSAPASGKKEESKDRQEEQDAGTQEEGWQRQKRWQTEARSKTMLLYFKGKSCPECGQLKTYTLFAATSFPQAPATHTRDDAGDDTEDV